MRGKDGEVVRGDGVFEDLEDLGELSFRVRGRRKEREGGVG